METKHTVRMTLLSGKYTWTGLKNSAMYKPNDQCFYKSYWGTTDHEVEDGVCYSYACGIIAQNPDKDPIESVFDEANKSPRKLYKDSMKELNRLLEKK